jgi:recombination protein RecA
MPCDLSDAPHMISSDGIDHEHPFAYYQTIQHQGGSMAKNSGPARVIHERTTGKEREKMIEVTKAEIVKKFGDGSIMRYGDGGPELEVEAIPTGALALDAALGIGGVPRGRIVEIYGPESSGKTTLSLEILAEAQAMGGVAAFIDAEHALDPTYAARIGVDIDEVLISQPDTGEQALEICDMLVRSGAIDVVVIDSVAALVPRAEIEGEIGETTVGLQARLMSQALRKLAGSLAKSNTTCIFINQLREKIGVMFGNPETTTGGRALKFFSSVRIDIRRIESIKVKDEIVGNRVRAKVVKNKVAAPFRTAEFDIMYGTGISKEGSVLDMAVQYEIVSKSGAWYTYDGDRLGQGREAAKDKLRKNPELMNELDHKVRVMCGLEFEDEPVGTIVEQDGDVQVAPETL